MIKLFFCCVLLISSPVFAQSVSKQAHPPAETARARAFLQQKGVVIAKEYTAPVTLDTKNNSKVQISGFVFTLVGKTPGVMKGLRVVLKPTDNPAADRIAYLDLDEADQLIDALDRLIEVSGVWISAKKTANGECDFATQDGFGIGFFIDPKGAQEGYFTCDGRTANFAMSAPVLGTVRTHLVKLVKDLRGSQ